MSPVARTETAEAKLQKIENEISKLPPALGKIATAIFDNWNGLIKDMDLARGAFETALIYQPMLSRPPLQGVLQAMRSFFETEAREAPSGPKTPDNSKARNEELATLDVH